MNKFGSMKWPQVNENENKKTKFIESNGKVVVLDLHVEKEQNTYFCSDLHVVC